jgi:hypothetical protein
MTHRAFVSLFLCVSTLSGCKKSESSTHDSSGSSGGTGTSASSSVPGKPQEMVKLSKYNLAEYCDLAVGSNGVLHVVFNDSPDTSKPTYLYYRASTDGGATWSEAKNLSDDESGRVASFCRVVMDAKGRVYAIWKYIEHASLIDGPGGNEGGVFVYRCLEGGTWSKAVALNKQPDWGYSFFAAVDSHGVANVVWSQVSPDVGANTHGMGGASIANLVQQVALDGASLGQPKGLVVPERIKSEAEWKAAGIRPSYDQTGPKQDGIYNLRGYIDGTGVAHFVGERPKPQSLVHFDGKALKMVYTYIPYASGNTFNNPATLLVDADGVDHVIRSPEKSETPCVRDYLVGEKLSDPTEIIAVKDPGKGAIFNWQVAQGPKGKIAVMCSLSQTGKVSPDDVELYVSFSDGKGKWSTPQVVTNNAASQSFKANNGVAAGTTYNPHFSVLAFDKDGHPYMAMVNNARTLSGINTVGITGSGQAVTGMASFSTSATAVYFKKL